MTFASRLQKLRRNRGLTQAQLADEIGVKQETVSGYERGKESPEILFQTGYDGQSFLKNK